MVLYLTLPSAIISQLNGLRFPSTLLVISLVGFLCNWLFIFISHQVGKDKDEKSFMMLNINGFNIGNFALPFIAFFLEGLPILAISLFDAGSSLMVLGGNFALAKSVKGEEVKLNIPDLLRTVVRSPAVLAYIGMVTLSLLSLDLPSVIADVTDIIGRANTFLAMFLIGVALDLQVDSNKIKKLSKYLSLRYVTAMLMALLVHLVPVIPTAIKQTLTLLFFAPISGSAPIFTSHLDSDVELSAQINSLSIVVSIVLMSAYLIFLGV